VDTERMAQIARWRSASEAARILSKAYDLARAPEVRFSPGWALRAYRVRVLVDQGSLAASP
jgi:hypothetical protein